MHKSFYSNSPLKEISPISRYSSTAVPPPLPSVASVLHPPPTFPPPTFCGAPHMPTSRRYLVVVLISSRFDSTFRLLRLLPSFSLFSAHTLTRTHTHTRMHTQPHLLCLLWLLLLPLFEARLRGQCLRVDFT
jgi:hypothetical protein